MMTTATPSFQQPARLTRGALAAAALLALGACTALAPNQKADAPTTPAFLETPPGWMAAAPADTLARGPWWTLFNDPVLDQLAPQVAVNNQNIAAAAAAVEESRAVIREQQAALVNDPIHDLKMLQLFASKFDQRLDDGALVGVAHHERHARGCGLALARGVVQQERVEILEDRG